MLNIGSRLIPLDWNGQKVPFPRSMAKSGWIGGGRKHASCAEWQKAFVRHVEREAGLGALAGNRSRRLYSAGGILNLRHSRESYGNKRHRTSDSSCRNGSGNA